MSRFKIHSFFWKITALALLLSATLAIALNESRVDVVPIKYRLDTGEEQKLDNFPFYLNRKTRGGILWAEIRAGRFPPSVYAFKVDDCIEKLSVNGMPYASSDVPYCDKWNWHHLDLGGLLRPGNNVVVAEVKNKKGRGRLRFILSARDPLRIGLKLSLVLVIAGYLLFALAYWRDLASRVVKPTAIHFLLFCASLGFILGHVAFRISSKVPNGMTPQNFPDIRDGLFLYVLAAILVTLVVGLAGAFFYCRRLGGDNEPARSGALLLLRPLVLLLALSVFFQTRQWLANPLFFYFLAIFVCALLASWSKPWLKRISAFRVREQFYSMPWVLLWLLIAAYVSYTAYWSVEKHYALETATYDLAMKENVIWNTSEGRFMMNTIIDGNYIGEHPSFFMLLLVPLYKLFPHSETLLIVQSLLLGFAALPLFLSSRELCKSSWIALLLAAIYLSHPAIGGANFFDFHMVSAVPLLLFSLFYFWHFKKNIQFWTCVVLLFTVKEDIVFLVLCFGAFSVLSKRLATGLRVILSAIIAYVLIVRILIPSFDPPDLFHAEYFQDLILREEGPFGLLKTLFTQPLYVLEYFLTERKILYLLQIFAPLGFLPFFTLRGLSLISYGLLVALCAERSCLHQIGYHYAFHLVPFGLVAMSLWLGEVREKEGGMLCFWNRGQILLFCSVLSLITCYHYGMIYPRHNFRGGFHYADFEYTESDGRLYWEVREFIKAIPPEAPVLASERLLPQILKRKKIAVLRLTGREKAAEYDYIFFDRRTPDKPHMKFISEHVVLRNFEIIKEGEFCILFRRKTEVSQDSDKGKSTRGVEE